MNEPTALHEVARGAFCIVCMTQRVRNEFKTWDVNARAGLHRIMTILAEDGFANLNHKQFRSEDRWKPKGHPLKVMIYAVKDFQVRLYGGFADTRFGRRFICTCFDASKKRNRADQEALQRAADYLGPFLEGKTK